MFNTPPRLPIRCISYLRDVHHRIDPMWHCLQTRAIQRLDGDDDQPNNFASDPHFLKDDTGHPSSSSLSCSRLQYPLFIMAYHQVTATSLTPSRPAPQAPIRRENSANDYSTNSSPSGGYSSSLSFSTNSPSASPYAFPYSGIGGSPNRGPDDVLNSPIVRSGSVSMKEDGFGNWLFQRKWLVLKEQTLSIHKNEVCVYGLALLSFFS